MIIREQRVLFGDILRGSSVFVFNDTRLTIRHLNYFLLSEIDVLYSSFLERAISSGVPTEQERLSYIEKNGQWTQKDEDQVKNHEQMIEGLETTKKKLFLQSQINQINDAIVREKRLYGLLLEKKHKLIGVTAEKIASDKISAEYIYNSIYLDNNLYFKREDFDALDDIQYKSLEDSYNKVIERLGTKYLMKLAISDFIQNLYDLCDERIVDFYGVPATKLTIFQEELMRYVRFFSPLLKESGIDPKIKEDPEKLIDYVIAERNLKQVHGEAKARGDGKNVSIVGMTQEDSKKLGVTHNPVDALVQRAKSQGKSSIDINEIMK